MSSSPRSMLFVSGEKPERFEKALSTAADLVCVDLEDAVHPARKASARDAVFAFAAGRGGNTARLAVRLNGLGTRDGLEDVRAFIASGVRLDTVLVPKVESAAELALLQAWVPDGFEHLVALIETPSGIEHAAALADAARRGAPALAAMMLGGADLAAELGAGFGWDGLLSARGRLVNAARSAGLEAWDVPHLDLDDLPALAAETRSVLQLGFSCKTAIHPAQIATIHAAFEPTPVDLQWALDLLEARASHDSASATSGAFLFRGKMVDAPVLRKARDIVRRAPPSA